MQSKIRYSFPSCNNKPSTSLKWKNQQKHMKQTVYVTIRPWHSGELNILSLKTFLFFRMNCNLGMLGKMMHHLILITMVTTLPITINYPGQGHSRSLCRNQRLIILKTWHQKLKNKKKWACIFQTLSLIV